MTISNTHFRIVIAMSHRYALSFALIATAVTQPSIAEERKIESVKEYERKVTDNWTVQGISYPNRERNDVCLAWKYWKDGSRIELVKDLKSSEFYIWHQTMGWNRINDEKMKTYSLRINFYDQQGGVVDGGAIEYKLINKNTIVIPQIDEKRFLKSFVNSNRMLMIPEGNVSNTQAYFDEKANDIATVLADCVQAYGKTKKPATASGRVLIEPPSLDPSTKVNTRDSL